MAYWLSSDSLSSWIGKCEMFTAGNLLLIYTFLGLSTRAYSALSPTPPSSNTILIANGSTPDNLLLGRLARVSRRDMVLTTPSVVLICAFNELLDSLNDPPSCKLQLGVHGSIRRWKYRAVS